MTHDVNTQLCGDTLEYDSETRLVCDRPKGHDEPHYDSTQEGYWGDLMPLDVPPGDDPRSHMPEVKWTP